MVKQSEVAFNIGVRESNFVADTYIKIFRAYRDGHIEDWFWSVNVLREMINAHLLTTSQENLDSLEEICKENLKNLKSTKRKDDYIRFKRIFADSVKTYMRQVMLRMKKLGYLPTKRDRAALGF